MRRLENLFCEAQRELNQQAHNGSIPRKDFAVKSLQQLKTLLHPHLAEATIDEISDIILTLQDWRGQRPASPDTRGQTGEEAATTGSLLSDVPFGGRDVYLLAENKYRGYIKRAGTNKFTNVYWDPYTASWTSVTDYESRILAAQRDKIQYKNKQVYVSAVDPDLGYCEALEKTLAWDSLQQRWYEH